MLIYRIASGIFLHCAKFHAFREWVGNRGIKNRESLNVRTSINTDKARKLKPRKFSYGGDTGESAKVCSRGNFPLYGKNYLSKPFKLPKDRVNIIYILLYLCFFPT